MPKLPPVQRKLIFNVKKNELIINRVAQSVECAHVEMISFLKWWEDYKFKYSKELKWGDFNQSVPQEYYRHFFTHSQWLDQDYLDDHSKIRMIDSEDYEQRIEKTHKDVYRKLFKILHRLLWVCLHFVANIDEDDVCNLPSYMETLWVNRYATKGEYMKWSRISSLEKELKQTIKNIDKTNILKLHTYFSGNILVTFKNLVPFNSPINKKNNSKFNNHFKNIEKLSLIIETVNKFLINC